MKRLNLSALREISLIDMTVFLSWLHKAGETVTFRKIQTFPPIKASKLSFLLNLTKDFSFITYTAEIASLTSTGLKFSKAESFEQMKMICTIFLSYAHVQDVMLALEKSPSGRLKKELIEEMFSKGNHFLPKSEVSGFLAWAQTCELLSYDKMRKEIFLKDSLLPTDSCKIKQSGAFYSFFTRA